MVVICYFTPIWLSLSKILIMDKKDVLALKPRLDTLVRQFNVPEFVIDDPLQFPKRFDDKRDIEISAMLTSTIAWGRRNMILRDAERMHALLDNMPYPFIMEGNIDDIPDNNIHRTFFGRHLRYFLRGLRQVYTRYGSLEDFTRAIGADKAEAPAWEIARALNCILAESNAKHPLDGPTRCLPDKVDASALKRFNMALRWLVRNDGIADIGVWTALRPSQLFIPLDVHSGNTARELGLLTRKANDRRAVEELTSNLRLLNPDDPTIYDFALFGAGVTGGLDNTTSKKQAGA